MCDTCTCTYVCMLHTSYICMCVQYMYVYIYFFLAIVCEEDSCGENEVCKNTPTGFVCQCDTGYERDEDVCSKLSIVGYIHICISSWLCMHTHVYMYIHFEYVSWYVRTYTYITYCIYI